MYPTGIGVRLIPSQRGDYKIQTPSIVAEVCLGSKLITIETNHTIGFQSPLFNE